MSVGSRLPSRTVLCNCCRLGFAAGGSAEVSASGSGADESFQASFVADEQCGPAELGELLLAEFTQNPGDRLARGADQLRNFFVGKRNLDANPIFRTLALRGPLQQQARQLLRNRVREAERADHLIGVLAVLAEMLGGVQAGVPVIVQETQEIVALDEIQLAGLQGFGGELVRLSRHGSVQSQHLARLRYAQDE